MNIRISNIVTASFLTLLGAGSIGSLARADAPDVKSGSAQTSSATVAVAPVLIPVIPAPMRKAPAAVKPALVRNIELIEKKGGVIVRVHLSRKAAFTHQIEPAKDGKPYRIILDCQNSVHNIGANRFMTLPQTVITSIRTSQFAVKPSKVCRIVLDLKKEAFYKIQAAAKHIDLFVTDASVNSFDSWSSASFLADQKAKKLAAKKVSTKTKTLATADVKKSKVSTARSTKQSKQPVTMAKSFTASLREMSKPSAKSVDKKSTVKKSSVKKSVVKSDKPVIVASKKAPSKAKSVKVKSVKAKKTDRVVKSVSKKPVTVAKSIPSAGAKSKKTAKKSVNKKSVKSSLSKTKTAPVVASVSKTTINKKSSKKSISKKSISKKFVSKKPVSKKSVSKKPVSEKSVSKKPVSKKLVSKGSKKSAKAAKSSSSLFASSAQAAIKPSAVKKTNADKGYSAKFRRSVDRRKIKLKGTLVAEFPKRLTIKYKSRGTRDPFASLFDKRDNSNKNMLDPRPNVESLTMVGVSRDVDGKTRGLFEDIDGRGYILSKGDRVEHGAVIKITSKKAYFQIFEYGWSRTVALSLEG